MKTSKRNRNLSKFTLLFLVLILILLSLVKLHKNSKMCPIDTKEYSDQELLIAKVKGQSETGELKLDSQDASAEAYLVNHPNCCYVRRPERQIFNLYGLLANERIVHMEYTLSEKAVESGSRGIGVTYYEQDLYVNSCMEVTSAENQMGSVPRKNK